MDIATCVKERRGMIFHLNKEDLIAFFQPAKKGFIRIPQLDLPNDSFVSNARYDSELDLFVFLVYHDSFEKVPPGFSYPLRETEIRLLEIETVKDRPERLPE